MEEFDKKKAVHFSLLVIIVIATAAISAFTLHTVLMRLFWSEKETKKTAALQENRPGKEESPFPKDKNGVYILPTPHDMFPLMPGEGSVGGVTACGRLFNLRACLTEKKSPLASQVINPVASAGAGLEDICGKALDELAPLRPQTVEIGCIW